MADFSYARLEAQTDIVTAVRSPITTERERAAGMHWPHQVTWKWAARKISFLASRQQKAPRLLAAGLFGVLGAGVGFEPTTFRL